MLKPLAERFRVSRPHFFAGQLVDYKDFNRLAAHPDEQLALLFRHLFEGGGIIVGALGELAAQPLEGFSVLVSPGLGLLPTGEPLYLAQDLVVDLKPFQGQNDIIVVGLRNSVVAKDRYVDQEDASIVGFRTETFEPELVFSSQTVSPDAIEIFRVRLTSDTTALRNMELAEEWQKEAPSGAIDLGSRKRLVPPTFVPLTPQEILALRESLYLASEALRKMERIYLIEDPFDSRNAVSAVHAEMLVRPFQPSKVAFLVADLAERLSNYLERLNSRLGSNRSNFDRETLLQTVALLDTMKPREALPHLPNLNPLIKVAEGLKQLVEYAELKFSLLSTVEEALQDLRHRFFEYEARLVLGGHLFERVDTLTAEDESRVVTKGSAGAFHRLLSTRFPNGDLLSLKGKFQKEGAISLSLKISDPERPVVCLLHQYVRRAGSALRYEINGKHLVTDTSEHVDSTNHWLNRALVIAPEYLTSGTNILTVSIEKSDLDFGFFDLVAYQPVIHLGRER